MQERHANRGLYFKEQAITTWKYMIPYIEEVAAVGQGAEVLEVGCGEGGNLLPFCRSGCRCTGIDLVREKVDFGRGRLPAGNVTLICRDIHDVDPGELPPFDLIFSRDVLEHVRGQERFVASMKRFLKPGGVMFFAFPPWYMPFGGHQQSLENRFLSRVPFLHLLPAPLYARILRIGGESKARVAAMLEIKRTGISIHRFNKILRRQGYEVLKKTCWLVNPNYETKFGWKPRASRVLGHVPLLREFFTTCYYCVVRPVGDEGII